MPASIAQSVFTPAGPPEVNADQVLNQMYHEAMLLTGGDPAAATAMVRRLEAKVRRFAQLVPLLHSNIPGVAEDAAREALSLLESEDYSDAQIGAFFRSQMVSDDVLRSAGLDPVAVNPDRAIEALIPSITGDDPQAATRDLRRALQILRDYHGLTSPEPLYYWLGENVLNDDVLRGAGIDPEPVRAAVRPPDPHPDMAALLELARSILESMNALGTTQEADAEALADLGRSFQQFLDSQTAPSALDPNAPPETGTTVSALVSIPIRV